MSPHPPRVCAAFLPAAPLVRSAPLSSGGVSSPVPVSLPVSLPLAKRPVSCVSQHDSSSSSEPNVFSSAASLISSLLRVFTPSQSLSPDAASLQSSSGTATATRTTTPPPPPLAPPIPIPVKPPSSSSVAAPTSPSSPTSQQRQRSLDNKNNNNSNPFADQDQQQRLITSPLTSKSQSTVRVPVSSVRVPFSDNNNNNSENIPSKRGDNANVNNGTAQQQPSQNRTDNDDDGVRTRMAARKSRSPSVPERARKRRRTSPFQFFSRQEPNRPTVPTPPPSPVYYPGSLQQVSNDQIFFLIDSAIRRRPGSKTNVNRVALLPYDLQRSLFDKLSPTDTNSSTTYADASTVGTASDAVGSTSTSVDTAFSSSSASTLTSPSVKPEKTKSDGESNQSLWDISARFAVDAFRFATFQQPLPQSTPADISNIDTKPTTQQNKASAYTAAAMASVSEEVASEAGGDASSAAAAYAAATAIASSAAAALHPAERAGLQGAVEAARAIANAEDAAVFVDTVGVAALVGAAGVLPGAERAAALTALANIAIVLPKARKAMLVSDDGAIVEIISDIVLRNVHFSVATSVTGSSLWYTEALVSSTHLLGSLSLSRHKEGRGFRARMAKDSEIVRRLERIAGGLKNGEAEGAARAARRALGALGINRWKPRMPGQKGLRILSIDGGGTRAILAFETLKQLKKTTGCEIHELFDIIGGTSTGAIVAASIGLGHKTVEEVDLLYRDMIGKVFARNPVNGPKMLWTRAYYDTKTLESTLQRECGRGVFIDSLADDNMNRVFVVSSVMSRDPKELFIFRNYTYPLGHESRYDGTSEAQLWEGLRASSAAPTFFSEIRINGELHADGAIVANNPTAVALHETRCMFPGVPIELVVSLGNGVSPRAEDSGAGWDEEEARKNNLGWGDVVGSIVASATSTETVHHAMQDLFPEDKYFRFNPTTGSTQIDETAPETLAMFVKEAQDYIAANVDQFDRVARILRPKTPQSLWRRFRDALRKEIQELESTYWDDDLYLPK